VTAAANFSVRAWFGAASYGNLILVVGGATYAPVLRLNDVHKSSDGGVTWQRVTAAAGFAERYGFSFLVHDSLTPPVAANLAVASNVFSVRTQLLVVAGSRCEAGCTRYNTSDPKCGTLAGHAYTQECCVSQEKCLQRPNSQDIWASDDSGATWALSGSAAWPVRTFAQTSAQVDGSLLLAGGYDSWDRHFWDVWRSFDGGTSWERVFGNDTAYSASAEARAQDASAWRARSSGQMAVVGSCPVLLGGHTRSGAGDYTHFNDAWTPAPLD